MDNQKDKRIKFSNKISPVFYGLSSDLIFFIAINVLFLTTVKGLNSSEINLITTIGVSVALVLYLFAHKIINKIGNIYSIRLGAFLMLCSATLFTVSNNIVLFAIAQILYDASFVFKSVDQVVLSNNLIYQNRENEFIKIKTKSTTIYSLATMIATLMAGFLFNINPFLPMYICILICLNNFIMSHFIYEVDFSDNEIAKEKSTRLNFNGIIIMTIFVYALIYGTIHVCQINDKLFMQYELQEFLENNSMVLMMSVILFLSRVSRLISNIVFYKVYDKLKDKSLYIIYFGLLISVLLFVLGKLLFLPLYGSILMAIGFIILLALRDPTENILSNILLKNTKKEDKEKVILWFQFSRRFVVFILSLVATLILSRYELINLYYVFLILVLLYIFIIIKLFSLLKIKTEEN